MQPTKKKSGNLLNINSKSSTNPHYHTIQTSPGRNKTGYSLISGLSSWPLPGEALNPGHCAIALLGRHYESMIMNSVLNSPLVRFSLLTILFNTRRTLRDMSCVAITRRGPSS